LFCFDWINRIENKCGETLATSWLMHTRWNHPFMHVHHGTDSYAQSQTEQAQAMAGPTRLHLAPDPRFACSHSFSPCPMSFKHESNAQIEWLNSNKESKCLTWWFMHKFYSLPN
jgi:hypothetical protein